MNLLFKGLSPKGLSLPQKKLSVSLSVSWVFPKRDRVFHRRAWTECFPEPAPESVPEETGAEGNSEQWTTSQVPANAGGWPRTSLLPGGTPDTKLLQEAPDQGHITRISCLDLSLYENWGSLSSKRRAKRASKLRSRGLPVPSETGFISIVADWEWFKTASARQSNHLLPIHKFVRYQKEV